VIPGGGGVAEFSIPYIFLLAVFHGDLFHHFFIALFAPTATPLLIISMACMAFAWGSNCGSSGGSSSKTYVKIKLSTSLDLFSNVIILAGGGDHRVIPPLFFRPRFRRKSVTYIALWIATIVIKPSGTSQEEQLVGFK
jgi:hypothetical protein